ncbi:hypothetical protein Hneap_0356 [Halothiobacillus neapolitanus c2]|uniref:Uncharacterized protein n=1 Tax=Halothiobacillus neapolitanus (strain ATCC 23641 / DSM 15147 / CIP 104769 / NCIMB 8539 / c2) TaxID=555778 RepID=D0KXP6_HALNC|nr:hypothetical protein Hneap_0356 [Halothiobacillus neapolitanus c2]
MMPFNYCFCGWKADRQIPVAAWRISSLEAVFAVTATMGHRLITAFRYTRAQHRFTF